MILPAVYAVFILLGMILLDAGQGFAKSDQPQVVFIPIKGNIEPGVAAFVERSLNKAYEMGAAKVILDIDTPGGLISSAQEIKSHIFASRVPTIAYISGEAKSAGVLISLAAEKVYMNSGASIGAAEPIPNNPKILASWRSDLEGAAEARGRRTDIVAGMADKNVVIENLKEKGQILSLSAQKAVSLGIADKVVADRSGLMTELSQSDGVYYQTSELTPGWGEKMAWWVINPYISPILLMIGFAGLLVEVFTPGMGIGGIIGLVGLGIYFGGHMLAGVTGWLAVLIFVLGIITLLLEIFIIPGFGVAGILGLGLVVWSIFLASTSSLQAVVSLSVAALGSLIMLYVLVKVLGRRGMWNKLILGTRLDTETGYTAASKDINKYMNLEGIAVTPLRPAGTAELNGDRVDVVTEGGFIPQNARIKVVLIQGGHLVVRQITK